MKIIQILAILFILIGSTFRIIDVFYVDAVALTPIEYLYADAVAFFGVCLGLYVGYANYKKQEAN